MPESSLNEYKNWPKHEIFSKSCIPPETPFFIKLDGWRFKKVSEAINAEKPFDEKFTKCLVSSGKVLFIKGFNPALIYVASDELNVLFLNTVLFRGRVEKTDSVLAGIASSVFSLSLQKLFSREPVVAFDSRVVIAYTEEKIIGYLSWRQMNAWRNHNNAYAYWVLRRTGFKPSEIARKLKGLKAEELHEIIMKQGVNLAETPRWQRRGILVYKQRFLKQAENHMVTRWRIKENWSLPPFTKKDGAELIHQILELSKQKKEK
jgi:tRNA(His) guanylyltransferase